MRRWSNVKGNEVAMPTDFDDFSRRRCCNTSGQIRLVRRHLRLLQGAMARAGFYGLRTEWWHFVSKDWKNYPDDAIAGDSVAPMPRSRSARPRGGPQATRALAHALADMIESCSAISVSRNTSTRCSIRCRSTASRSRLFALVIALLLRSRPAQVDGARDRARLRSLGLAGDGCSVSAPTINILTLVGR